MPSSRVFPSIVLALAGVLTLAAPAAPAAPPLVPSGMTKQVAPGVHVIPDQRVNLVPNIGIIVGEKAVLVVDTGMGPRNARTVLEEVRKLSDKPIRWLVITHFHPEHGMGASAFPPETAVVMPAAQRDELRAKGAAYVELFKGFGPEIAELLADVELVEPDVVFDDELEIDLGGRVVRLLHWEAGHTGGDMLVWLPAERVLFGGDLIVNRFFPIMPDATSSARGWRAVLARTRDLAPAVVVPGHGAVGDAALIDAMDGYLGALQGRTAALQVMGEPLAGAKEKLTAEFTAKYPDWDNPNWIGNAVERMYQGR